MKKLYFLVVVLLACGSVKGQVINFPDAVLKNKLVYYEDIAKNIEGEYFKVDINNNGEIEISEALEVEELNFGPGVGYYINDYSGIEYFTNLKSFKTNSPSVTTLDLSMLANLKKLIFNYSNLSNLILSSDSSSLEHLEIDNNLLTTLDLSGKISLKVLKCNNNNLSDLNISGCVNLISLDCGGNNLSDLNLSGFINLKSLYCNANNLSELNFTTAVSIEELYCDENNISSLDVSMLSNLIHLDCSTNQMSQLNLTGLIKLEELNCSTNQLTSLDLNNLIYLKKLDCFYNQLSTLNIDSLVAIEWIYCNNNPITSLSAIGLSHLKQLNVNACPLSTLIVENLSSIFGITASSTNLTTLDVSTLTNLIHLICSSSSLSSLNVIGASALKNLTCSNNQLEYLDLSGMNMITNLYCSNNLFTTLDLTDLHKLNTLWINDNPLIESIFMKNGGPYDVNAPTKVVLYSNPNLQYICADESKIAGLQLKVDELENNCVVNSYCSFIPGGIFYTISGSNTFDNNNNGCDASDESLPNLKLNITNGTQTGSIIANQSGEYSIPVQEGTHTITPILENPSYYTISTTAVNVTFPTEISPFTQNFCITPNGIHPDLEVALLPTTPARPGFDAHYKLIIKNKGNIQQSGSVSLTYNDAVLDYVNASPVFTTQAEGSLAWAFTNLEPFETREINVTLNVNSPMETPAVNGDDVLTYTTTITSDQTDELPLDNTFSLPQIVVNSFDPNDKTCLEGTAITPDMIGKYVHYMIRFENTGTFAAENIVVKDMIDTAKFDVSSLIALSGSHPYVTRINGNKVEFIFEGINLPFDDANNDGYLVFKIKTLPTLTLGDSFSNTASIYFDYNHPIVTEPAVTTFAVLGTEDFVFNNYFTLYPNPTNGILNITSKETIELQNISIYNVLGQMVVSVPNAKGVNNVDVSNLSTGNYFIKVVSDKGTSNSKFIKQ